MNNNIAKIRKEKALSLRALSKLSGVALSTLCEVQNNKQDPSILTAYKISGALGLVVSLVFPEPLALMKKRLKIEDPEN